MTTLRSKSLFVLLCFWQTMAFAAPAPVSAQLIAETSSVSRGADYTLAVRLVAAPGWHTYWKNPGDTGMASAIHWQLPTELSASAIEWPAPSTQKFNSLENWGYTGEHWLLSQIHIGESLSATVPLQIKARVTWLACKDICIPGEAKLELQLPVTAGNNAVNPEHASGFEIARALIPEPLPTEGATFGIGQGHLMLRLPELRIAPADKLEFYPEESNLVSTSTVENRQNSASGLRLDVPLSPKHVLVPNAVTGVVVLNKPSGERLAYHIQAASGALTPLPAVVKPPPVRVETSGFWQALIGAFLGGMLLNLMPCVFPVLSLKALSLLSPEHSARQKRQQALAYAAGTLVSCLAIAAALLILKWGGQALGWGFQLQSPAFVGLMVLLMFALGLSLSGVAEIGGSWTGTGSALAAKRGNTGAFFTGVLAVVVASPCVGPFMGSALGFAATQPAWMAMLIFSALGLGLSAPFVLLGFVPQWGKRLPRPGLWMLQVKQFLAFPMYATAIWLLWVLLGQTGVDTLIPMGISVIAVAIALWLWGQPQRGRWTSLAAVLSAGLALSCLTAPALHTAPAATNAPHTAQKAQTEHRPWSPEAVQTALAAGQTVFVNFTADWCLTCKLNERGVLKLPSVEAALRQQKVTWLTADWTRSDPAITAALAEFGRNGVPLYVVYSSGKSPQILPQILSPANVLNALPKLSPAP